jgi:hypothetical protein
MEIGANKGGIGQSPFSRPPQARPSPTFGRDPATSNDSSRAGTTYLAPPSTAPEGVASSSATTDEHKALESQRRSGAQWFYWIAGLSLINAGIALSGQGWRFILGLGVTQLVQELAQESGGAGIKAGLVGLGVIAIFGFLGQRAVAGHQWAFVAGMVLYAIDGAIFLLIQDWVGVGFHAFALMMIGRGYMAARKLPAP